MFVLSRGQSSSSAAVPTIHPLYAHGHHGAHAAPRKRATAAAKTQTHVRAVRKAVSHKAVARPVHKTATKKRHTRARGPAVVDGMPAALAYALRSHDVAVLAIYSSHSGVDVLALDEARAGASSSGAGFASVDVTSDRQSRVFTNFLTTLDQANRLLDAPAVFVFERPKMLFVRLNGFADRDTVAQAVQNAAAQLASATAAPQG